MPAGIGRGRLFVYRYFDTHHVSYGMVFSGKKAFTEDLDPDRNQDTSAQNGRFP